MNYLTPPQVGKLLGVSPDRIRNWIASGQLEAVNLSDGTRARWRITQEAVDAFLLSRTHNKRKRRTRPSAVEQFV